MKKAAENPADQAEEVKNAVKKTVKTAPKEAAGKADGKQKASEEATRKPAGKQKAGEEAAEETEKKATGKQENGEKAAGEAARQASETIKALGDSADPDDKDSRISGKDAARSGGKSKKPSAKKAKSGEKEALLERKYLKKIKGYQVEYSLNKDFSDSKKENIRQIKDLNKFTRKLKDGEKYYLRVRIYAKDKKEKYFFDWSEVKTLKIANGKK